MPFIEELLHRWCGKFYDKKPQLLDGAGTRGRIKTLSFGQNVFLSG